MGPLEGVRVIDLTQMLAGPYATMLMADLGADVIKVEPPSGDFVRQIGPYPEGMRESEFGGYFQSINRGKRSIVVDLKSAPGREELHDLIARADVLVENFSPGVMERLGVAYEDLRETNPRLVYGAIRGFGDARTGASPYAEWPALDLVSQAMGGIMSVTGPNSEEELKVGVGVGDIFPAALFAVGVVSAVLHAWKTGKGQFVDVAMYDGMLALCERIVYQYSYTGQVPVPTGNRHPILSPFEVLDARDGKVVIAAPSEPRWRRLCELTGNSALLSDPRLGSNDERAEHKDVVFAMLQDWVGSRTMAEVLATLGGEVPVAPVQNAAQIFADPHVATREMLVEVEHPGAKHPVTVAGCPIKLSVTPSKVGTRAPLLDEHGSEVRQELGLAGRLTS